MPLHSSPGDDEHEDFINKDEEDDIVEDMLTPPPQAASLDSISYPSGLPLSKIATLTHDELRNNSEFKKYVEMVAMLQELLSLRQASNPSSKFFFISFFLHIHTFLASAVVNTSPFTIRLSNSTLQISPCLNQPLLPLVRPRRLIRPAYYSHQLLWTWDEALGDPRVCSKE